MTDPALVRVWPRKWLTDPDIEPTIRYLDRFLHDFKFTTDADISTTVNRDAYDSTTYAAAISEALRRIECLENRNLHEGVQELQKFHNKVISREEFTATDFMIVNMTNNSTLNLPANPVRDSRVIWTKDHTTATIRGNGKKLNGTLKPIKFTKNRAGRQCVYFIETDEWWFI